MITIRDILLRTETYFSEVGIASPRREIEEIVGHVFGLDRIQVYMHFDRPIMEAELVRLRTMVARRGKREPLQWILGEAGFHDQELIVQPGVLCPRPDTELLVECALELIPEDEECFIADIGCGSGCVGLSILAKRALAKLYAVDIAEEAIERTRANMQNQGSAIELGC